MKITKNLILNKQINNRELVIIGGGFRALLTAAILLNFSKKITIISKSENNFHGVMSPLKIFGGNFDKGYQFLDGFSEKNKNFLEKFLGKNVLYNFGYGASSYTNNKIYPFHGIPYWPDLSKIISLKAFLNILLKFPFSKKQKKYESYQDLLNTFPSDIGKILKKACIRNTLKQPEELSSLVSSYSHFLNYRLTLMPDIFSNILKKIQFFDERLASRRFSLNLEQISLYPKNKYIGIISEIFLEKLKKNGIKLIFSNDTKILNDKEKIRIKLRNGILEPDYVFINTELNDMEKFFENKIFKKESNSYVSQVFYYFVTKRVFSRFQYVHGNDANILTNRVSNHSLYGEKTINGKSVLSAEVPTAINSNLWNDPEKYKNEIWNEIISMKFAEKNTKFEDCKIFNIPKTVPIPLISFEKNFDLLKSYVRSKFNNKIFFPGIGIFTRNLFLESLRRELNFNE